MKMPFGKYKGRELLHIAEDDLEYFSWLTSIELTGKLKDEVLQLAEEFKDDLLELPEKEEWDRPND